MDKIATAIEPMLVKLSEVFNVSVEFMQENAMTYILEYGRYRLAINTTVNILLGVIIGSLIGGFLVMTIGYDDWSNKWTISKKGRILIFLAPVLALTIFFIASDLIPYLASPIMYSIEQVSKLIK